MSIAKELYEKAYANDYVGGSGYERVDREALLAGGVECYNSNDDGGYESFSPTVHYKFSDGSVLLVAYQHADWWNGKSG